MWSLIVYCNEAGRQQSSINGCMSVGHITMFMLVYQPHLLLFFVLVLFLVCMTMLIDCVHCCQRQQQRHNWLSLA